MVQSAVQQTQRRRVGLGKRNTQLNILIDDPINSEWEENAARNLNQGFFTAHGEEYVFDKRSLWLFPATWKLRKLIVWIIVWPWFDYFILVCILANSINLALYDFSRNKTKSIQGSTTNDYLEIGFSFVFFVEAVLKIIGMGFMFHK